MHISVETYFFLKRIILSQKIRVRRSQLVVGRQQGSITIPAPLWRDPFWGAGGDETGVGLDDCIYVYKFYSVQFVSIEKLN